MPAPRPLRKRPPPAPLPVGTRVGAFVVRGVLGLGQFGYGYRVWDTESEVEYALKEYLPQDLAQRVGATAVRPLHPQDAEAFALGLKAFLAEGSRLSPLRHPTLVPVYGCWEENGSAYMAMDLITGRDLRHTMQARGRAPREGSLRAMLEQLLGALQTLHGAGLEHRDIAPSSIVIGPDHRPVLMDLGAPRRLAIARGQAGGAGPREGFAPPEMYPSGREHKRGPWTDIYALGAVMHCLMTGRPPAPAPQRLAGAAALQWPAPLLGRYSLDFLALVQWMLAPSPQDRPQDVQAVRAALTDPRHLPAPLRPGRRDRLLLRLRRHRRWLWALLALLLLALSLAAGLAWRARQTGWPPG